MTAPLTDGFFAFARERYRIHLAKSGGAPGPWTEDPALREWRFCNIFREDDRTTKWFRDNVRGSLRYSRDVLFATIAFRWFNRIETGVQIQDMLLNPTTWSGDEVARRLKNLKHPFTGAYVIKSPDGLPKVEGICRCIDRALLVYEDWARDMMMNQHTLKRAWELLQLLPFMGPFMAYEVVTDLRHTVLLEGASDIMTWANPGPGARRGLAWVAGEDLGKPALLPAMQSLLLLSTLEHNWPRSWPRWEMREVEHTLCEYDKICRARAGQQLKRRYTS